MSTSETPSLAHTLRSVAGTIMLLLLILVIFAVGTLVISFIFVGVGWVMTQFFRLTLFEAAVIVTAIAIATVYFLKDLTRSRLPWESLGSDWDDEDDLDEDDWEDEEEDDELTRTINSIKPPPSRNDPCPCGSGKKYKYCHGK